MGNGRHRMNDMRNLTAASFKDAFTTTNNKTGQVFVNFHPDKIVHQIREIGAIAKLEIDKPGWANIRDIYKWIKSATEYLDMGDTYLQKYIDTNGLDEDAAYCKEVIKIARRDLKNLKDHRDAQIKKQQTKNLIAETKNMGFRKTQVKFAKGVRDLDFKTLVAEVKKSNDGISDDAARMHAESLVSLNGQIDVSQLKVPSSKSNASNPAQPTTHTNQGKSASQSSGSLPKKPEGVDTGEWNRLSDDEKREVAWYYSGDNWKNLGRTKEDYHKVELGWITQNVDEALMTPPTK